MYNDGFKILQVYDNHGCLVKEYQGQLQIETDGKTYILFDDDRGERHTIYFTSFNIIIDELVED